MKKSLLAILIASASYAQTTVSDVLYLVDSARTPQSQAVTITASQGDGTKATITKFGGSKISFGLKITAGDGVTQVTQQNIAGSAAPQSMVWGYGDVLCLLAWNPTTAAVTMGSIGSVGANSLAWACSTNVSTAGVVSGQTAPVTGSVAWP